MDNEELVFFFVFDNNVYKDMNIYFREIDKLILFLVEVNRRV